MKPASMAPRWLRLIHAQGGRSRCPACTLVARTKEKSPPKKEAVVLKGGRHRDRPAAAARTEDQIDSLFTGVPCARNILSSARER